MIMQVDSCCTVIRGHAYRGQTYIEEILAQYRRQLYIHAAFGNEYLIRNWSAVNRHAIRRHNHIDYPPL